MRNCSEQVLNSYPFSCIIWSRLIAWCRTCAYMSSTAYFIFWKSTNHSNLLPQLWTTQKIRKNFSRNRLKQGHFAALCQFLKSFLQGVANLYSLKNPVKIKCFPAFSKLSQQLPKFATKRVYWQLVSLTIFTTQQLQYNVTGRDYLWQRYRPWHRPYRRQYALPR